MIGIYCAMEKLDGRLIFATQLGRFKEIVYK